ncbi:LysR family transcriptional regulator [Octadecabacter sp. 1_MG-2023]|uniref:LysR family transcriptional regulator n=1 Tax=unclassified Octadecabacter TaxID=196158 RepID=UPI001C0A668E|nr:MULTISPECIES: LysR family transcriptional regulator [unclassified Octadecabacter]MBU2992646.1 LysR family transcriptional regulator [Octadecabacter sp. B2R22]MDO6733903.1 LysR family transcriptional regulator [Octadecabacter sp. 1_MG-2023]
MNIDPRHLEQLAAILEFGTFNEAAKRLGTSQSALSRMITDLEIRIGTQLFERSRRPLMPTEVCKKLANHGRTIDATRRRALEDIQIVLEGMSGELKIGAPPFLCQRLVGEAISSFLQHRPEIEVKLVSEYFPQLERRILLNQLDVIICPLRLLTASIDDLTVAPLFQDAHVIAGRAEHWLLKQSTITADDLEKATWVSHADESQLQSDMAAALTYLGVRNLKIAFQSGSAGAILEMLRHTDFLTVLPRYALRHRGENSRLAELPVQLTLSSTSVGMVSSSNRLESPLLAAFTAHMREYVAKESPALHLATPTEE